MSRIPLTVVVIILLVAPTAALAGTPPATLHGILSLADGDYSVPHAWAGIWNETYVDYDCDSGLETDSGSLQDTLCTGDPVDLSDGAGAIICNGTVTDTAIDIDCNSTMEVFPGCTATFNVSFDATRTGDTYQSVSILTVSYNGDLCGEFLQDTCTRSESEGTRTGPEPPSCQSPVEGATWGAIKARYR